MIRSLPLLGLTLTLVGCSQPKAPPAPVATAVPSPSPLPAPKVAKAPAALPFATAVQGPATSLPPVATPLPPSASPAPATTAPLATGSAPVPVAAALPTPSPAPLVIPVAKGPLPELRLDSGKGIPVVVPRNVALSSLKPGSQFFVVVEDDGIPFRSGVDENLDPGTRLYATVEKVEKGRVQFLFTHAVDGAGKRYDMIAGLSSRSGGHQPAWQRDADDKRRQVALKRTHELQEAYERDRSAAFDTVGEARSRDAEWAGDIKSMGVVLPWAMGSKGLMIGVASYLAGKVTNQVRNEKEAARTASLDAWNMSRQADLKQQEELTKRRLAEAYVLDAYRAARTTLRTDLNKGDQMSVMLAFPFSTTESTEEILERIIP